jgi:hypothetical protein
MKFHPIVLFALVASAPLLAQPSPNANVPRIRFESVPDFLHEFPDRQVRQARQLGEVVGIARA